MEPLLRPMCVTPGNLRSFLPEDSRDRVEFLARREAANASRRRQFMRLAVSRYGGGQPRNDDARRGAARTHRSVRTDRVVCGNLAAAHGLFQNSTRSRRCAGKDALRRAGNSIGNCRYQNRKRTGDSAAGHRKEISWLPVSSYMVTNAPARHTKWRLRFHCSAKFRVRACRSRQRRAQGFRVI